MTTPQPLVPTAEEISKAQAAYAEAFREDPAPHVEDDNPFIQGRAEIYALCRQYPEVAPLLGNLNLDAPRGFGVIDVGLPNDPVYVHVVLDVESILELALNGDIALNQQGYPDYTGTERLRG